MLSDLSSLLEKKCYAMINLGSVAGQSIAGAISTGTQDTSNKNFILKYFRCRDGKRTIGMEGICITHSCIPPL